MFRGDEEYQIGEDAMSALCGDQSKSAVRSIVLLALCFGCAPQAAAATVILGGNVTGSWTPAGSPYDVQGDITVPNSGTLSIQPGTSVEIEPFDATSSGSNAFKIEFNNNAELVVDNASIIAQSGVSTSWVGLTATSGSTTHLIDAVLQGNLFLQTGADYLVSLFDNINYDTATINGAVSLGGNLVLSASSLIASPGDSFLLLINDGTDPISGIFNGLPEGSILNLGGVDFTLSYLGGDGNDVQLKAIKLIARSERCFSCEAFSRRRIAWS
jgi:hypothetical protein